MGNTNVSSLKIGNAVSKEALSGSTFTPLDQALQILGSEATSPASSDYEMDESQGRLPHDDSFSLDGVSKPKNVQTISEHAPASQTHVFDIHVPQKHADDFRVNVPVADDLLLLAENCWKARSFEPAPNMLEVLCAFISGICNKALARPSASSTRSKKKPASPRFLMDYQQLLQSAFSKLREVDNGAVLSNDIHALTSRAEVVQAFLTGLMALDDATFVPSSQSALLRSVEKQESSLFVQFGGQGYNWLEELSQVYTTYPSIRNFIEQCTEVIQAEANSLQAQVLGFYRMGFDVMSWVRDPSVRPPMSYITSAPISYPMVCLTQLVHYMVALQVLNKTPAQLIELVEGLSGHSQGVVSAVVVSCAGTVADFVVKTQQAIRYMFWHGARTSQVFQAATLPPRLLEESVEKGWGIPTPMLSIRGLEQQRVEQFVTKVNTNIAPKRQVHIALVNGRKSVVVAGEPHTLHMLRSLLATAQANANESQSRIPYSKRKPVFSCSYLSVSAPFHTPLLAPAVPLIMADIKRLNIEMDSRALKIPVFSTFDASNLQGSKNLMQTLVEMQCTQPVHWKLMCDRVLLSADGTGASHVLDFGPGGISGMGRITAENCEGYGVQVILAGSINGSEMTPGKASLFDSRESAIPVAVNWMKRFGPILVKERSEETPVAITSSPRLEAKRAEMKSAISKAIEPTTGVRMETRFTKVFGKPPVLVAGMTPTTVGEHFCAAVTQAGYNVELAGGGQPRECIFRKRIADLTALLPSGDGITVNLLFLNPKLWAMQFPLILSLRKEGYPIDGVTIAAGVPSANKADEILEALRSVGIKRVGFKPGSVDAIKAVLEIASRNPASDIVIQWTGGRSGGHHSFEDQHEPVLRTYGAIRKVDNVVLVVGGGIGDHSAALPYITGQWSVDYGYPAMPFDGVLVASRVMVCKEAPTAPEVKQLIADTPGTDDTMWEQSFDVKSDVGAGGIITINSELGEPIHKISNRGTRFWRHMDENYFSLPKDKLVAALARDHKEIVDRINADFQKPYFAQRKDGTPCYFLQDLTYADVASRMAELMYPIVPGAPKRNWIDPSYRTRFGKWVVRVIERFSAQLEDKYIQSLRDLLFPVAEPDQVLHALSKAIPLADITTLSPEDENFFVALSRGVGKPVNFIPAIDADLKFWMKKDSLWYSEDLRSVPNQDPQRVMVLQGPVATRSSSQADQPVKEVLDEIYYGMIKAMVQQDYAVVSPSIARSMIDEFASSAAGKDAQSASPAAVLLSQFASRPTKKSMSHIKLVLSIPQHYTEEISSEAWLRLLATYSPSFVPWRTALLLSPHVIRNKLWKTNVLAEMFKPRPGQTVQLISSSPSAVASDVMAIRVFDKQLGSIGLSSDIPAVEAKFDNNTNVVSVVMRHPRCDYAKYQSGESVPPAELRLNYTFKPFDHARDMVAGMLIEEDWQARCNKVSDFYRSLWVTSEKSAEGQELGSVVTADAISRFRAAIGDHTWHDPSLDVPIGQEVAPIDFGIVLGWEAIVGALLEGCGPRYGAADLLSLVHLSNEFKVIPQSGSYTSSILSGDRIESKATLEGVWDEPEGRTISVRAILSKHATDPQLKKNVSFPVMEVFSRFAIRVGAVSSTPENRLNLFKLTKRSYRVALQDETAFAILASKKWHDVDEKTLRKYKSVQFDFQTKETLSGNGKDTLNIVSTGDISDSVSGVVIGHINWNESNVARSVVLGYMQRHTVAQPEQVPFANAQYYSNVNLTAPSSNFVYALASKDVNPIHLNPYSVALASLPDTIVHGMYSSSQGREVIQKLAHGPVVNYRAEFKGMVLPSMKLVCQTSLGAMGQGRKMVTLDMRDAATGMLVLRATGEVHQPPTAYVFTGQGSAVVGMGMDLYSSSAPGSSVRNVWDSAEAYFQEKYGFSILQIVKHNPKQLTISLSGPRGQALRANYAALCVEKAGEAKASPLFPDALNPDVDQITFASNEGLLFQTQFQQPAILLAERASFEDLQSRGVVIREAHARFAGHSLGEYGAIGCLVRGLSVATLAEVVFLRGLTMQSAVPRDSHNRSRYGMVAVSPLRLGPWFTQERAIRFIDAVETLSGQLLQVVNYNVRGSQYVVAGHLTSLEALRLSLDELSRVKPQDLAKDIEARIKTIIENAVAKANKSVQDSKDNYLPMQRGVASIPLPGIDVPFHSRLLMDGVASFRKVLDRTFYHGDQPLYIRPDDLEGKYIPNLLGTPFILSLDFAQTMLKFTKSPILEEVVANWESAIQDKSKLCLTLLIELLAYQFASPVQWIETQDQIVQSGIRRFVEIGPSPVLLNMAKRSYGSDPSMSDLELLWAGRDMDKIACEGEGSTEGPEALDTEVASQSAAASVASPQLKPKALPVAASSAAASAPASAPAPVAAAPRPVTISAGPSQPVPLSALHALRVIVASKLGVELSAVSPADNIRKLCGGKSALQNEILGDLSAEFKTEPEGADELPLTELANKLAAKHAYSTPGRVLSGLINRKIPQTMPGGFGIARVKDYYKNVWNMDASTIDGCMVHSLSIKSDRLDSEAAASAWLDSVAEAYASVMGGNLSKASAGGSAAASGGAVTAVVDAKEVNAIKALIKTQAEALHAYMTSSSGDVVMDITKDTRESWLNLIESEHGAKYVEGIRPSFDIEKVRFYDSWWNWARQDAAQFLATLQTKPESLDASTVQREITLLANRTTDSLLTFCQTQVKSLSAAAAPIGEQLVSAVKARLHDSARYMEYRKPSLPLTSVNEKGEIKFTFQERYADGVQGYVRDMIRADNPNRLVLSPAISMEDERIEMEQPYAAALEDMVKMGASFAGKTALITGAGAGSIGAEVARCLLLGGCHVVVTTSRPTRARWEMYRKLFKSYGGKGGKLTVVPFNGASMNDVEQLVNYMFDPKGLNIGTPDFLLPFAAIPENGRDISLIDAQSELAHRTMLTNVVRLIGSIKKRIEAVADIPGAAKNMMVLLPLSPNHGLFGGDGLYSESKIALETLFAKWRSEGWGGIISVIGAEIGWTRGTGLMSTNDLIAEGIETRAGLRTFDTTEMAFNLVSLMTPQVLRMARICPIKADFSGGFKALGGRGLPAKELREELMNKSKVAKSVYQDLQLDSQTQDEAKSESIQSRALLRLDFPEVPEAKTVANDNLQGMLDLSKIPVVVGFGEVGPWGSAHTRWEWEAHAKFSREGAIELARAMNLIAFHSGPHDSLRGLDYVGWVDVKTKEPVADDAVYEKYGDYMRKHCGIREIEPALFEGYDPTSKMFLQQVALEADMPPFEVASAQEVEHLRARHGNLLQIQQESGRIVARLKKGAVIYVPKTVPFNREIAGQLPTGWDPAKYGIPADIKVDPVTLFALGATIDAFCSAGINDPYELYKHVHVSEVGNSAGGGMGGMASLKNIFRHRMLEKGDIASDVLQETFINTTSAWINMLLLSSSGPIKTPVAACATAATSMEIGVETIKSGKAKVMITGGYEDFGEEGSFEFAQMKATSDSWKEKAMGREPDEMCRPATSTRGGFMEAQGAGIQILMSADLALEMGVPIYAIVAGAYTATDRQGRSVPAPGQGILTTARERRSDFENPLLSLPYRRSQLAHECVTIQSWLKERLNAIDTRYPDVVSGAPKSDEQKKAFDYERSFVSREYQRRMQAAQSMWGNDFYVYDPEIAPLRGSLAVWGLGIDDLEVVSFHGTGTMANDKNESDVIQRQMAHLGRTEGHPIPSIFQKWMTGHPKGAAAAWMLHGVIQSMLTGLVPGNRNADNVDSYLEKFTHLLYLDTTLDMGRPLKAAYLHSFGFGQAGAELVVVHPDYVFKVIETERFSDYRSRCQQRKVAANRYWLEAMCDQRPMAKIKQQAPFEDSASQKAYLNPVARTSFDEKTEQWSIPMMSSPVPRSAVRSLLSSRRTSFSSQGPLPVAAASPSRRQRRRSSLGLVQTPASSQVESKEHAIAQALSSISAQQNGGSIGIDVEDIASFRDKDDIFLQRNFTSDELAYCQAAPDPAASLAARWCAKEAVIKALSSVDPEKPNGWQGASAPLRDIEVVMTPSGAPSVNLSGVAHRFASSLGAVDISVSLSHTAEHAVAQAFVRRF